MGQTLRDQLLQDRLIVVLLGSYIAKDINPGFLLLECGGLVI